MILKQSNILFATVDLPSLDKSQTTKQILSLPSDLWFWDHYRSTNMLPLMTRGGLTGNEGASNNRRDDYDWISYTPVLIRTWFESYVFPWMGMRTRIMALLTKPNHSNYEHVDCDFMKMGTQQHKFRVVLQGNTDTLYFITKYGNVNVPGVDLPFIMDGSWPHGMINKTDIYKLTIAAGSPWNGNESYNNITPLLYTHNYTMPTNINPYFKQQ